MKKKILFIDDDPTIRMISEMILKDLGYDVITADGGLSGIEELLKINTIDLIFLDLMMPDIYGLDVLKYIKEKDEFKNIPVVIQSGIKNTETDIADKLGASYILLKPYNKKDLQDIIGPILNSVTQDIL